GWDAKVTPSLAAAIAVVAIEPRRSEELFEHLRIFIRSDYPGRAYRGTYESMNSWPNDLVPTMARLPAGIAARLAAEIREGEMTNEATKALNSTRARLELLGGL